MLRELIDLIRKGAPPVSDIVITHPDLAVAEMFVIAQDGRPMMRRKVLTHSESACDTNWACPLHSPSNHPLRWGDLAIEEGNPDPMFRLCRHGHAHPDPDSVLFLGLLPKTVHMMHLVCDGCCR